MMYATRSRKAAYLRCAAAANAQLEGRGSKVAMLWGRRRDQLVGSRPEAAATTGSLCLLLLLLLLLPRGGRQAARRRIDSCRLLLLSRRPQRALCGGCTIGRTAKRRIGVESARPGVCSALCSHQQRLAAQLMLSDMRMVIVIHNEITSVTSNGNIRIGRQSNHTSACSCDECCCSVGYCDSIVQCQMDNPLHVELLLRKGYKTAHRTHSVS